MCELLQQLQLTSLVLNVLIWLANLFDAWPILRQTGSMRKARHITPTAVMSAFIAGGVVGLSLGPSLPLSDNCKRLKTKNKAQEMNQTPVNIPCKIGCGDIIGTEPSLQQCSPNPTPSLKAKQAAYS
mmetsp:Transcript_87634/g.173920  ORF Transcript_87634/g.173920 Transcript_87634/m.173920 type:complete len:127 (-) Transcript_87634:413-793(-)